MKRFALILIASLISTSAFADIEGVKAFYGGQGDMPESTDYRVEYYSDADRTVVADTEEDERLATDVIEMVMVEAAKQVRRGYYIRGYEIDGWNLGNSSEADLIEELNESYEDGDGSAPWEIEDIEALQDYFMEEADMIFIGKLGITANYYGGTGIVTHYMIYNARTGSVLDISRLHYAE